MSRKQSVRKTTSLGFTLIELLIVVAIIAILAAIAVPNFLEAQVRSKVSRAKSDLRSIATGMEAYALEYHAYPLTITPDYIPQYARFVPLTTPIAYLSSVPLDPFQTGGIDMGGIHQSALSYLHSYILESDTGPHLGLWLLRFDPHHKFQWDGRSFGPDRDSNDYNWHDFPGQGGVINYDPSNGTRSEGDVVYFGPGGGFEMNDIGGYNQY